MISYIVVPIALTLIAARLFWLGLRTYSVVEWRWFFGGVGFLVLVCVWLSIWGSIGGLTVIVAFFGWMLVSIVALVAGILLAAFLPGKHKLVAGVIVVAFPVLLLQSILWVESEFSYESQIEKNGRLIAQVLIRYRADNGTYPETLAELVPDYLSDLNQPTTMWGWLYRLTDGAFVLGYVIGIDRYGYSIRVLDSATLKWDTIIPPSPYPFNLQVTPGPPLMWTGTPSQ